jgi:hypothetical protein
VSAATRAARTDELGLTAFVEQEGTPKLCDGGRREEEEGDEDTDLGHQSHRDPDREIDKKYEKN